MSWSHGRRRFLEQARITRGALLLLVLEAGLSLVWVFSNPTGQAWLESWVMASDRNVWHEWRLWTLVTGALFESRFINLIFHGLILWMFVPSLERWWGTRRFLVFAAATSITGNVAGTLAGLAMPDEQAITGLSAFIDASIVAFGVIYARHPVQFFGVLPMTGKQLAIGISGFVLLFVLVSREWALGAAYASAMALAWALTSDRFRPRLWWLQWRQRRIRRHLGVVRGGRDDRWIN